MGRTVAICVLLSLAAMAWADTSYQNYQTYQDQQNSEWRYHDASAPSNNYYQSSAPAQRRQGIVNSLSGLFPPSIRRQFDLGGLELSLGGVVLAALLGLVVIAVLTFILTQLDSSGRGLTSDEWEVDHSVWMNQLQKDFEDSWSDN